MEHEKNPRVLVLMSRMPWPLDDGGRVGLYQIVWSLSRRFDVILAVLVSPREVPTAIPAAITDLGVRVIRVAHRPTRSALAAARSLFGGWPYTLARFRNARFDRVVRELVRSEAPDLAYLSSLHMATYIDALGGTPTVLREQNVEYLWLERYAASLRNPLARAYAREQSTRLRRAEAELSARMSLVLAIHEPEAALIRELAPKTRVEVIPIAVDPARFRPRSLVSIPAATIVGAFGWPPNLEGLRRFLAEGWPSLRRHVPAAVLRLVGKDLPMAQLRAQVEGVEWIGYVDSIEAELARATVLIVPLWVGAGARVKIVEALMAGTPVVSTSLGAEGLGLTHDRHLLIAETPAGLAEATAALMADPGRASRLAATAREFALEHFSLDAVAQRTCDLCEGVMRRVPSQSGIGR
jgi:glycosyltransferase involved in cell wall biosynthesis